MSKRRKQKFSKKPFSRKLLLLIVVLMAGGFIAALLWPKPNPKAALAAYRPRPAVTLTFNKDIAPVLFQNCSGCHRPTQSGPFGILSYADAKEHGKQIAEVTRKRVMPP